MRAFRSASGFSLHVSKQIENSRVCLTDEFLRSTLKNAGSLYAQRVAALEITTLKQRHDTRLQQSRFVRSEFREHPGQSRSAQHHGKQMCLLCADLRRQFRTWLRDTLGHGTAGVVLLPLDSGVQIVPALYLHWVREASPSVSLYAPTHEISEKCGHVPWSAGAPRASRSTPVPRR